MMPARPVGLVPLVAAVVLAAAACAGASDEGRTVDDLPRVDDEGRRIIYSDADGDGNPEVTKYFVYRSAGDSAEEQLPDISATPIRELALEETDLDVTDDGLVNHLREYRQSGGLHTESIDGNLDGIIDRVIVWENGEVAESEVDSNFDGNFDEYRFYRAGALLRVLRDRNEDGVVDQWSYYDHHGLARVGRDTNWDGIADSWIQRE